MSSRPDMPALRRADLDPDPAVQFDRWFELARERVPLPEAMTLATVDPAGAPDARMVLLKGADQSGFRFYTNSESIKGIQLGARPSAALILYWRELDRQVRIRGPVERLSGEDSDAYFAGRHRDSQLGAWASPQSEPLANRAALDNRLEEVKRRFGGEDGAEAEAEVPRPPHWGGYLVVPETVEFWQGQVGRLHDRFRYSRAADGDSDGDKWRIERLAP